VKRTYPDEIGRLIDGFNEMLEQIQDRDKQLAEHRERLEELVNARTAELSETNVALKAQIQEREKIETQLIDAALSMETKNQELADSRDFALEAARSKAEFLATMSHELRTPLSGALGTLRLLSDTSLQPQQLDYVHIVNAANASLLDIVNDILGYSQLEAGKLNIENRRFDLSELLNNVIGLMMVSVRERNNSLQLEVELEHEHSQALLGDSGKLHQILINLVGNANKFTNNGSITLRVNSKHDPGEDIVNLQFSVIDTGIGIAKDKQEDIFRAFTQVDASSARLYGGIGLGLAICERLVNAMGGKISLESKFGEGTKIGFSIDVEICRAVSLAPPIPQKKADITQRIKVLMVEDDATNSMVTNNYLQHLGHQVIATQSGEEAISLLDKGGMSLVLLDISLPGIDGLTILSYIRTHADKTIANLPVIAMSAHVFTEEVDHYLCAGMNGFLGKPFSLEDLEHAIGQAIDGHEVIITNTSQPGEQRKVNAFDTSVVENDIGRLGLDSVEKYAALFFQSAELLKAELIEAMEQGNFDKMARLAHRMNGAAGNFGLQRLCALLARIETQSNNGTKLTTALVEQFQVEFGDAIAALTNYLSEQKVTPQNLSA